MTEVQITAADGGKFAAHLALPKQLPAAGIVLIQEIFGINKTMRGLASRLAEQGFLVYCPDLFWRLSPGIQLDDHNPDDMTRAFELFQAFDVSKGVRDLQSTLESLRRDSRCNGKVGAIGYCLGGKLAYLLATRSQLDASISYYGVGLDEFLSELTGLRTPLLLHVAGQDRFVPAEARAKILAATAVQPKATALLYPDQDHAFARPDGEHFVAAAAQAADARSLAFLKQHLTGSERKSAS